MLTLLDQETSSWATGNIYMGISQHLTTFQACNLLGIGWNPYWMIATLEGKALKY